MNAAKTAFRSFYKGKKKINIFFEFSEKFLYNYFTPKYRLEAPLPENEKFRYFFVFQKFNHTFIVEILNPHKS